MSYGDGWRACGASSLRLLSHQEEREKVLEANDTRIAFGDQAKTRRCMSFFIFDL